MEPKPFYTDRFDKDYLAHLKWLFGGEGRQHLIATAEVKKDKKGNELRDKKGRPRRIINIDYCGFAGNTLLVEAIDGAPGLSDEVIKLREEVVAAFKGFMSKKSLADFEVENIGVKVRFCLNYIYSDFPVCMASSERSSVWTYEADDAHYSFHTDDVSLTPAMLKNSIIADAQRSCLRRIVKLLKDNNDLVIIEGKNKYDNLHSLQVRFAVVPIGICSLQINNTIFCDGYLYSKIGIDPALSVRYPLHVLNRDTNSEQFTSVLNHNQYLWRLDSTLFCQDASAYKPGNEDGLFDIKEPFKENGTDSNIDWEHKIKVILEKKQRTLKEAGKNVSIRQLRAENEERIAIWRNNLNAQLYSCTRKLSEKDEKDTKGITLEMGLDKNVKYYVKLNMPSLGKTIDVNLPKIPPVGYFNLLHLAYARQQNVSPVLNTISSSYANKYMGSDGKEKKQVGKFVTVVLEFLVDCLELEKQKTLLERIRELLFGNDGLETAELLILAENIKIGNIVRMLEPGVSCYYALLNNGHQCEKDTFKILHPLHLSPNVYQLTFPHEGIKPERIIGYPKG